MKPQTVTVAKKVEVNKWYYRPWQKYIERLLAEYRTHEGFVIHIAIASENILYVSQMQLILA